MMNEAQAEKAAQEVIARATAESMTVEQARQYAHSLGIYLTPGLFDPESNLIYRGFVYIDNTVQLRKIATRIVGLSGDDGADAINAASIQKVEDERIIAALDRAATKVDHPSYYNMGGPKEADGSAKYEAIKIIEDWGLGFNLGNALKYILRAPYKGDSNGDLNKACWYLDRFTFGTEPMAPNPARRFAPTEVSAAWGLDDELAAAVASIFERNPIHAAHAISYIDTYRVFGKKT